MKALIIFIIACFYNTSHSVEVDRLYLETEKYRFIGPSRSYKMFDYGEPRWGVNLGLDLSFNPWMYSRNKISSLTDSSQFRYIDLNTELGIAVSDYEFYIRHMSGHALDTQFQTPVNFPEENVLGFRWYLLKTN